ncbi:MAG: FkbM family methyltransferase [Alphaproteobacteria bacterium]|nr:FkbM family methyltransferase [Alphaproteobacteria bacterium]
MSNVLKYKSNISGAINIGADFGQELDFYLQNNIRNIAFFEPRLTAYGELIQNINKTDRNTFNIQAFNVGLGEKAEKRTFYEAGGGQASSFLKPKEVLTKCSVIKFWDAGELQIETLDSYNFDSRFNYIHLDVQGFELSVLKGGINTLKNIEAIDTEINFVEMYEGCPLLDELDLFLSSFNFLRVETSTEDGWGDALYIKQ